MERFILQESVLSNHFICTDTINGVVVIFEVHKYNETQSFEILEDIESPIIIDEKVYIPKLILSEDEFTLEGAKMKNCMSKQFLHGSIYLYVSLSLGNRRINIHFNRGLPW